MLLAYGWHPGSADWKVQQKYASGYVRVYDVVQGEIWYRDKQRELVIDKGMICLLPSAEPFVMNQDSENPLQCTFLHLDISPGILREPVILDAGKEEFLKNMADSIKLLTVGKNDRVISHLSDAMEEYFRGKNFFTFPDGEIARVVTAMMEDIRKDWTVEELSRMAGYSQPYFIRKFRAEMGNSPYQYLIARRMKEAVRLLWQHNPVTETALRIGYPDLKSFSRAFRKWYGLSPSECRGSGMLYL